jgi:hypothetical protein
MSVHCLIFASLFRRRSSSCVWLSC